jgi:hypothetical protein
MSQRSSLTYVTRHHKVMLALQVALLGEITANMRAVAAIYDDTTLRFQIFFDGRATGDEHESVSSIESGLLALFPAEHEILGQWVQLEFPHPLPKDVHFAYRRKEEALEDEEPTAELLLD